MADSLSLQNIAKLNAVQAVNSLGASAKVTNDSGSGQSFGNVLTKTAEKSSTGADVSAPAKAENSAKPRNEANPNEKLKGDVGNRKDDTESVSKKGQNDLKDGNVSEDTKDAVKEAAETVKDEIMEELDVSEEEIIQAMETLGLTLIDLLKGENIGALTAELTGNDISEVVSNESLYVSVESIMDVQRTVTGDLLQELNLTPEEFREALNSGVFEESVTVETVSAENTTVAVPEAETDETETEVKGTEEFRTILENSGKTGETVRPEEITSEKITAGTPAETVKTQEVKREPDRQPEREVEVVITKVSEDGSEVKDFADHKESGSGRHFGAGEGQESRSQGFDFAAVRTDDTGNVFMENLTEAVSETTSEFMNSFERVQDIMNQVRDQIRISVNQETTTMEMQLNPESLGKVGLHIESKAGNVTAQFIAQDESVRAALETQVAELKNTLQEQGIKIESVEVTIAAREFESNFLNNGGQGNSDTPDEEETERTARLRRINLGAGGPEGIPEEEMTEEEALNLRMMRENGGTVDFSA